MEKETIGRSAALLMEQDAVERDPTASPTLRLKILTSAVFNFISPDTRRRASIATVGARFARGSNGQQFKIGLSAMNLAAECRDKFLAKPRSK
jgi:hypothetical protein